MATASNWEAVTSVDDASTGYMPTISTDSGGNPHVAWSSSKTSGTVYYKNKYGGAWKPTVSWGATYTGHSVDVSPQNNYVSLLRYYEAATNEVQYTVCKNIASSNCDASGEFTKWDGTAGYDTLATGVESASYPSLATTYESNGDLWVAYAKDVDANTRAIYARYLDYPSGGWQTAETVDSLTNIKFTRPSIGVDSNNNPTAVYSNLSTAQVYYKMRSGGSWGTRDTIGTSSDYATVMVRSPTTGGYGDTQGGIYWMSTTSETYHFTVIIPEVDQYVIPFMLIAILTIQSQRIRRTWRRLEGRLEEQPKVRK